jgi:hypothetical protein
MARLVHNRHTAHCSFTEIAARFRNVRTFGSLESYQILPHIGYAAPVQGGQKGRGSNERGRAYIGRTQFLRNPVAHPV